MLGAGSELRTLKPFRAVTLVLSAVATLRPAAADAQTPDPDARAAVRVEVGATRVAHESVRAGGARILFRVASAVDVGGAARVDLTHPMVATDGVALQARFGYGGVLVELRPAPARAPGLRIGTLVGAGNLHLRDPEAKTLLDSDNGLVAEPQASWWIGVAPRLKLGVTAGWRLTRGFQALGGVVSADLRGGLLLAGVELGPF